MKWNPINILYIVDGYYPQTGWWEILFQYIAEGMTKKWHNVTVLTIRNNKTQLLEEIYNWVKIIRVPCSRISFFIKWFSIAIQLAKNIDIIHTATYSSALLARIVSKIYKTPIVITIHEIYNKLRFHFLGKYKWWLWYIRESLICSLPFDHYIWPSIYTINSIRLLYNKDDKKLSLIYHGIDYHNWDSSRFTTKEVDILRQQLLLQEKTVWLYFGRSGVGKGCIDLIHSIPHIIKQIPNFTCLMIIAYTPERPKSKIEHLIKELRIHDHIILHDSVDYRELPKYIVSSDMVIVPSHAEWFGFAAAEVCALNHPLIVSQVASLPEVVHWKICFCKPNFPESIANAVISMYQWKYTVIPSKKFDWDTSIIKHLEIYTIIWWK